MGFVKKLVSATVLLGSMGVSTPAHASYCTLLMDITTDLILQGEIDYALRVYRIYKANGCE